LTHPNKHIFCSKHQQIVEEVATRVKEGVLIEVPPTMVGDRLATVVVQWKRNYNEEERKKRRASKKNSRFWLK